MNTKKLVTLVEDSVRNSDTYKGISVSKVIDTILHSGVITMGNLNDQINCINRVAPNLPSEEASKIFHELEELGVSSGDRLRYTLTDQLDDDIVYSYKLGSMNLTFKKL